MMFEAIKDKLKVMDALLELGWTPTLNQIGTDEWHVGLRHECAPSTPELTGVVAGDGTILYKADGHPYHIHGHSTTLVGAIDNAVNQVLELTGQTYKELIDEAV